MIRLSTIPGYGTDAAENTVPAAAGTPVFTLPGICLNKRVSIPIDEETASRHMLLIGGTGCGKTNLMFRMADQALRRMTNRDVMIIFDSKGDYYRRFAGAYRDRSVILGNSPEYRDHSVKWNIFREVEADNLSGSENLTKNRERTRLNAMEIARSLFAQRMANTTNSFFPSAAQDIFSSLLYSVCRDAETDPLVRPLMNNRSFCRYIQRSDADTLTEQLSAYDELRAVCSYISDGTEQAQGVQAEMYSVLRDILIGVFAEKGTFSMREFVRARQKKILFLEYDMSIGSVLTPIYRLLIDLALKETLSQHSADGNLYLFCDEFKLVPQLQHIGDAVNFGRSKGVKVFAGLQSIEQLYQLPEGKSIAAGFSTIFAFHANDAATMQYISGLCGRNLRQVEVTGVDNKTTTQIQQGNVIEDWLLSSLQPGEAVVCLPAKPPFRIRFTEFT